MMEWYNTLQRPPLTPPNWLLMVLWALVYGLIVGAVVLYLRTPREERSKLFQTMFYVHLGAHLLWPLLFFVAQSPLAAMVDIIILGLSLVYLMLAVWPIRRMVSVMLLPYLMLVAFSYYLNAGYWLLN